MPGDIPTSSSAQQKKKRPMGLKARAAKKQKSEQPSEDGAQVVNDFGDENTATIMLKNDGQEANEIDELEGIFDGALEALDTEEPERALTLLRGTIHECDRILRVRDQDPNPEELEPRFYFIYGMALFSIAEVSEDDKVAYLELALKRLVQAEDKLADWKTLEGLAKVSLELLVEKSNESAQEAVERLNKALAVLPGDPADPAVVSETLSIVNLVLSLVDSRRLTETAASELVAWAQKTLDNMPKAVQESPEVKTTMASALWISAGALLDQQDEETGEVPEKESLVEILQKSAALLQDVDGGKAVLLRGEVFLNLGNLLDDEESQEKIYAQAVECFNKAKELSELPEQFAQFLEDFENDGQDDGEDSEDDEQEEE
ncbi:hypothetical protein GGI07_002054 [Coemansia sp. Benny D115]|nr:hypothetical protein GGI07_002054 [Coemansia sp. Benny D115]